MPSTIFFTHIELGTQENSITDFLSVQHSLTIYEQVTPLCQSLMQKLKIWRNETDRTRRIALVDLMF